MNLMPTLEETVDRVVSLIGRLTETGVTPDKAAELLFKHLPQCSTATLDQGTVQKRLAESRSYQDQIEIATTLHREGCKPSVVAAELIERFGLSQATAFRRAAEARSLLK